MEDLKWLEVIFRARKAQSRPSIEILKEDVAGIAIVLQQLVATSEAREIAIKTFKDVSELPVAESAHRMLLCRAVELAMESSPRERPSARILNGNIEDAIRTISIRHRVALVAPSYGWTLDDVAASLKVSLRAARQLRSEAIKVAMKQRKVVGPSV